MRLTQGEMDCGSVMSEWPEAVTTRADRNNVQSGFICEGFADVTTAQVRGLYERAESGGELVVDITRDT